MADNNRLTSSKATESTNSKSLKNLKGCTLVVLAILSYGNNMIWSTS